MKVNDLFELLEGDINYYSNYDKVIVCGDFNCRVGLKPDYIVVDRITVNIDNIDHNTRHAVAPSFRGQSWQRPRHEAVRYV